jgi:hypothetical protein
MQRSAERLQFLDLLINTRQMRACDGLDVGTGPFMILVERQQGPAFLDAEAERAGLAEKRQLVQVVVSELPIAILAARWTHETDILVVPDRFGGQSASLGDVANVHRENLIRLNFHKIGLPSTGRSSGFEQKNFARPSSHWILHIPGNWADTDRALGSYDLTTIQLTPVVDVLATQGRGHFALDRALVVRH